MKKIAILFITVILAASCSTVKVSSDFDKSGDFSAYKTYKFTNEALKLPSVNDINRNRILTAIETEMTAKGFTKTDENPDVLIDLQLKGEEKTQAYSTTSGSAIGYGRGYRYGWGSGFSTTSINYETYVDGTLFVDMIDVNKNQLVWQGRGTKTLDPDANQQKREQTINDAVKQIFTKYPPSY